jgi:receptor protein-tyrosine kinase
MNTDASDIVDISTRESEPRRTIGALLIEEGLICGTDIDIIQQFAREQGLRFGDAAVQLKVATQEGVDMALARQFGYPTLARGGVDGVADSIIAAYSPRSATVEPLRTLRSQLTLRWLNATPRKMLAIVSPEPYEGRSWLAANLATVFAQTGQRTLLIDADMRNPCQHRLFNLENSMGLSALLTGRTGGRDLVRRIHPELTLFVLPAGLVPPNPQELLIRARFGALLDRLAGLFDLVVLDTPAAALSADFQVISAQAGAAVLLSRRNRTRVSGLTATMQDLVETGVHVVGSVVNQF